VDLPVFAIDRISVVVDRDEIVVGADFLELAEGLHEERAFPQSDVVHGGGVCLDVSHREPHFSGEIVRLHVVEPPRLARRVNVVAQVGGFARQLVRGDDQLLVRAGNHTAGQHAYDGVKNCRRHRGPYQFSARDSCGNPGCSDERRDRGDIQSW